MVIEFSAKMIMALVVFAVLIIVLIIGGFLTGGMGKFICKTSGYIMYLIAQTTGTFQDLTIGTINFGCDQMSW